MRDFETRYVALKGELNGLEKEPLMFQDRTHIALQGWRYWAPVVILAAIAGHFV